MLKGPEDGMALALECCDWLVARPSGSTNPSDAFSEFWVGDQAKSAKMISSVNIQGRVPQGGYNICMREMIFRFHFILIIIIGLEVAR